MSDVNTWNVAAASNNAAAPNGFPEGMPPSGVNDAAREVMAAVARYRSDTDGVNTSSGTNTITLAASRTMTAYAQGDLYTFKAGGTNTGATTINVDSLGAKDVQFNGAACTGGEIVSGLMYTVVYDGTQFQLMNASSFPAIDITTLEVTNIKAKDGTAAATIADSTGKITVSSELAVDNINISGNTISSTDTNGNITLTPNGTGVVTTTTFDATNLEVTNIKAKDGTAAATIANSTGKITVSTELAVDNINISGNTISSTNTDGNIILNPNGMGRVNIESSFGSELDFSIGGILTAYVISAPGGLSLKTNNAIDYVSIGTDSIDRIIVDANGNVGLGLKLDPQTRLDINASNNALLSDISNNTLRFTDTDLTTVANQPIGKIEFYTSDSNNAGVASYILSSAVGASGGGTIRFGAAANAGAVAEIARVASTGLTVTAGAAGIGYGTGSGGAVTQATSRTTGVTLDKTNGAITLVSAAGTTTIQSFTVTNSTVAATDTIIVNQKSGTDLYRIYVTAVAAGSFRISFATLSGTTTEQPVFNFAVIKAVTA